MKMLTINSTEKKAKVLDGALLKLYYKLEEARISEKLTAFNIVRYLPLKSGFQVKIGGLYGFISIEDMPWEYDKRSFWKSAAPHLTQKRFRGKIAELSSKPLSIRVSIDKGEPTKPRLARKISYKGVILHKTPQYLIIDLGMYTDWKSGSVIGIAYRHSYANEKMFDQLNIGDTCISSFHGLTKKETPILEIRRAV